MKTQGFEQSFGLVALTQVVAFLIEQGDIHQAAQALLLVHHWQRQETVTDQHLAGIEDGCAIGQRDDGRIHQFDQLGVQRSGEQTTAG